MGTWWGSPPHTWRTLNSFTVSKSGVRITSTYVENTQKPRKVSFYAYGSPPHTWRTLKFSLLNRWNFGITSTYVENTSKSEPCTVRIEDHLHIRGEHSRPTRKSRQERGSPPHTWRTQ